MAPLDRRIFCISDLHIGGAHPKSNSDTSRGFRLCTQTPRLATFIRRLTAEGRRGAQHCELVINGDFVDFLAEEWKEGTKWVPFVLGDARAADRLSIIVERERAVFDSLREFLAAGNTLTVLLGNHDVELALPAVQRRLEQILDTGGKPFRFICDGQAYTVGSAIFEHGNRYDGWNVIDHDGLRRTRSSQSRKEPLDDDRSFSPPAGSWMVATVMNQIKTRYPFVDLLKPENEATLPILLTLAPEYREQLMKLMRLALQAALHAPDDEGRLRYEGDIKANSEDLALGRLLKAHVSQEDMEEFFRILNDACPRRPNRTEEQVSASLTSKARSLFPLITKGASTQLSDRLPALRSALITLRDERSFNLTQESDDYLDPAKRLIKRGFKVVLFGHTHLAKKVQVGDSLYLNTGTWADLIKFPYQELDEEFNSSQQWLTKFVHDMENGQLQSYIVQIPSYAYVELSEDGNVLSADIRTFSEESSLL